MDEVTLTPEQQAVVDNRGGALLVSAAAGSGKTKVLVDRVLKRITEENCNVDDFLMITFTQAAAGELRGKLMTALSQKLAREPDNRHLQRQMSRVYLAQISTVHAFCSTVLRAYAHDLDIPADFRVGDQQENRALQQKAMDELVRWLYRVLPEEPELRETVDTLGSGRDDGVLLKLIRFVYEKACCYPRPLERLREYRTMLDTRGLTDVGQTLWGQYLIEEFHVFLEQTRTEALPLFRQVEACPDLEKYLPFVQELRELTDRLLSLRTWEELRQEKPVFGRLATVKNCGAPGLQKRFKDFRDGFKKKLSARLDKFALPSREALADLESSARSLRGLLTLAEKFAELYGNEKARRHVLDYNDLEHETLRLLYGKGTVPTAQARELSGRYVEIMVDEYQDTNRVQDAIFQAIARPESNLFFVGDVKQSIYSFRLADPTIFLKKFEEFKDYRQAAPGEPRKILLSDNFRSHPEVLSAANSVFEAAMNRRVGGLVYGEDQRLRPKRNMPSMGEPAVELHCLTIPEADGTVRGRAEAEFVADRIREMLRSGEQIPQGEDLRPIRPEDVTILLRSVKGKASFFIQALRRRGIVCSCSNENLFDTEEIQFLTALLEIVDNPHRDIPLLTVLLSPAVGFQPDDLARLRGKDRRCDLWGTLGQSPRGETVRNRITELRRLSREVNIRELLEAADGQLRLRTIYGTMEDGPQKRTNIESFFALADGYGAAGHFGLRGFLTYLQGLRDSGMETNDTPLPHAVRIMSVHKSKGLEFPVVFLPDLTKGFNVTDLREKVLAHEKYGLGAVVCDPAAHITCPTAAKNAIAEVLRQETVSEEMRILYVAMTRAKYRMVMTCAEKDMEEKLRKLDEKLTWPLSPSLIEGAGSMGDWVLMTALTRTDGGALVPYSEGEMDRRVPEYPWTMKLHTLDPEQMAPEEELQEAEASAPRKEPRFPAPYGHPEAVLTPSKMTATQMKGTEDREEPCAPVLYFPRPRFAEGLTPLTPAQRGTAIHQAMQFMDFRACETPEGIRRELQRLREGKFLTDQQLDAVSPGKLWRFFDSPLGRAVRDPEAEVIREFKFSILDQGESYGPGLEGEEILLQGVTDCCILRPGGLVIVDFKSDAIGPGGEPERAEYYRGQLEVYSRALSRIFEKPVLARILYFFSTDTAFRI